MRHATRIALVEFVTLWINLCVVQRYLTALRREKEAFQQLIRERAVSVQRDVYRLIRPSLRVQQMVLPVDQGVGGAKDFTDHTHSRRAGGQSSEEKVYIHIHMCINLHNRLPL